MGGQGAWRRGHMVGRNLPLLPRVEASADGGLVASFGESVGVPMDDVGSLMEWVVFGGERKFFVSRA